MFTRFNSLLSRYLGASALALGITGSAWAQVPSSVDIDLAPGASANQLNVLMRANGNPFSEVFSGLTFTIRYAEASTATLSAGSSAWCPGPAFPIAPTAVVQPGNGFKYRTYNSVSLLSMENVDDGGCGAVLPVGEWVVVHTITVSNNPNCTEFQIVNDTWTQQNNRNFFVSLNGVQGLAGTIEPTPVQRGNCTADCAGVIGGTATIDGCGVCSGGTTGITPQQPASASFSYAGTPYCSNAGTVNPTFSGTTGGTFSSTAGLSIDSGTGAVNTGSSTAGSYTVTYTVSAYGTCPQFQTTAPITISALPVAGTLSGNQSICVGGATAFSSTVSGGTWSSSNEAVASVDPSTGAITGVSAGSATMTYTVTAAGCPDATATRSVTVTAAPVAGTISGTPQGICVGGTTTYTISGNSATGTWGTDNPAVATVVNGVVTGQGAGTTNITYTVPGTGGCAPATTSRSVTVTAAPVAGTISGTPQGICVGGTTTYTISGNSATGTWGTDNPAVATVVNGVVTGQGAGTTNITYTVPGTGGCAPATTSRSVTVTATPVAGTISGTPQGICVGGTTTYTISGNSATGTWGTDNPAVATVVNGVVTGQGAGTTNITYTVPGTGGCAPATTSRSVTVTAAPVAGTISGTPQGICVGGTTTYAISGNSATGTWGTDNPAVATVVNGVVTGQGAGTTNITYTVPGTGGCAPATTSRSVTVTATTNNTTTESACDSYTWSVNGVTYNQSGTYTNTVGCATETLVLTITPSTGNTTTLTECDSYTWPVNGVTYTQSGTYTSVSGCNTETLVLTIVTSTSNTTTVSECDSYTWNVNGQTYTESGTYTSVSGCGTQTLILTITPSTNNTTTESACDSYTWAVNGVTYNQSGTYTNTVGCATETLVLTITPSTNNTTTESACDSYTWAVNGVTYNQSGTYTNTVGCATETLVLTITPSTNNTTTESACDSYTWSVNGVTYNQSGTYTNTVGCATETLVLTITPSTNNTTTESACDSYTWAVNGVTYNQSGTYTNTVGCATETLVLTITPSTTNTVTQSACDSYTWAENGVTYNQSGTYTSTVGCETDVLVLTIVPSTSNTTTESACDSYTWAVNGVTYTQSGQYSVTNGCDTQILDLTITPSTSSTTTEFACNSYTWAVNGVTYTQSGTYTFTAGCDTEILELTISTGGTNTTTESACDSFTWAVNGVTYTQSGTYTESTGCSTEILVLTITPSSSSTTTEVACDSYTWAVNGVTYSQSGTYTNTVGCDTEILELTIIPITSNTTTESACDSYTWSVNGVTYSESGTYTVVNGCATEILVLTILQSGTNTTTESACDSYTWAVNGVTYTQSGTYTEVTGCSTEILVLTITASSTQSESVTACGTSYTWSVNGQAYAQSGTYTSVNGCVTSTLNLTLNVPGTPCDDGDENTINDALNINCVCEGTPVGPGCDFNELEIEIVTDGASTTLWEIRAQGTNALAISGGQLYPQGTFTESICLPDGCYYLVVTDDAGDGISGGGYVLRRPNDRRIIDNRGNFSVGYTSQIANGEGFCLPMGTDRLIATSCDREWWTGGPEYVVANGNPAVTAIWNSFPAGSTERATTGYQMWWFDPNGGYSFKRFQSHSTSNGLPASATRACHFLVNGWAGNQLQAGVLYNVRVRSRVLGAYAEFGPTCRFRIDATLAQCPPTQLVNSQGFAEFSCGVVRQFPSSNKIWAWSRPGANKYQFEFSIPAEGILFTRNSNTNWIALSWSSGTQLLDGRTYNVRVRVSKTNGATWCPWGETCTVAINNGSSGMAAETNAPVSGTEATISDRLLVWPNPNRGEQLNLRIDGLTSAAGTMTVDLYDLVGNRVMALTKAVQDGHVNGAIELPADLSTGMYMLQVNGAGRTWTERVVIQR